MTRLFKSGKLLVLALAVIMVFITACSDNGGSNAETNSPSPTPGASSSSPEASPDASPTGTGSQDVDLTIENNGPVTLQFISPYSDEWLVEYKIQDVFDNFTKMYPWITIKNIYSGGPIIDLQQGLAIGKPADLFWSYQMWPALSQGYIEDLTPYIEKDPDYSNYPHAPGIKETFTFQGHQFGVSRSLDIQVIYYNKTLLNQLNLQEPGVDWTYEDMKQLAKSATKPDQGLYGFGNSGAFLRYTGETLALANGAAEDLGGLNKDGTKVMCDANNIACLDAFNFTFEQIHTDKTYLDSPTSNNAGFGGKDLFKLGQALFYFDRIGMVKMFEQDSENGLTFEWGVLPYPAGTVSQPNYAEHPGLYMARAGEHKAETWAFLKYWSSNLETQKALVASGITSPNTTDAAVKDEFAKLYSKVDKATLDVILNNLVYTPVQGMVGGDIAFQLTNEWNAEQWNAWSTKPAYDWVPAKTEAINTQLLKEQELAKKVLSTMYGIQ